jgi:hypothetical protein
MVLVYPAWHWQLVEAGLRFGDCAIAGHAEQLALPIVFLKVLAGHATHVSLSGPKRPTLHWHTVAAVLAGGPARPRGMSRSSRSRTRPCTSPAPRAAVAPVVPLQAVAHCCDTPCRRRPACTPPPRTQRTGRRRRTCTRSCSGKAPARRSAAAPPSAPDASHAPPDRPADHSARFSIFEYARSGFLRFFNL